MVDVGGIVLWRNSDVCFLYFQFGVAIAIWDHVAGRFAALWPCLLSGTASGRR